MAWTNQTILYGMIDHEPMVTKDSEGNMTAKAMITIIKGKRKTGEEKKEKKHHIHLSGIPITSPLSVARGTIRRWVS